MPSLPEMLFGDNVLRIQHVDGYGIEFNAIDALKRVNNMEDAVKVACAQEWQESRWDTPLIDCGASLFFLFASGTQS